MESFEKFQEIALLWPEQIAQKSTKNTEILVTDPPQGRFLSQMKTAIR